MRELESVVAACAACEKQARDGVLVTVVDVKGPAHLTPGSRLLMSLAKRQQNAPDVGKLWWWTESGSPVVRQFDADSDDDAVWDLRLGRDSVVRVILERLGSLNLKHELEFFNLCRAQHGVGAMATVISSGSPDVAVSGERWFLDPDGMEQHDIHDLMVLDRVQAEADSALDAMRSRRITIPHFRGPVEVFIEVVGPAIPQAGTFEFDGAPMEWLESDPEPGWSSAAQYRPAA